MAEQDRALWGQGHVGRDRAQCAQLLGLGSSSGFGCSALMMKAVGRRCQDTLLHHKTVAVHFPLWASVSHLSANNSVRVLSLKCLERSSVDGIRTMQWWTPLSSVLKSPLHWSLLKEE